MFDPTVGMHVATKFWNEEKGILLPYSGTIKNVDSENRKCYVKYDDGDEG